MNVAELIHKDPAGIIARAYAFAQRAHAGQKRLNGQPYLSHLSATADILLSWKMDETTIAAGLLHDTLEDAAVTNPGLKKEFGDEIAFLVEGVTKIGRLKYRGTATSAENLRKMLIAVSEDLRVIFIKLADRLHNMKTLNALPKDRQMRIAIETDEIYAPLAYRLGMQNVSGELHDLAFPYLYPDKDRWLKKTVAEKYQSRLQYLKKMTPLLQKTLQEHKIPLLTIDYRAKRYSSLYKKLLRYEMDVEKIYDLVAVRIIVPTIEDCYATLGIIHQLWPPLPGRIKDYIAIPKPNGYRSLHTSVFGPQGKVVEIQIRTKEMHEENENGIAAHWLYKQGRDRKTSQEEVRWVSQLREWQESLGKKVDPEEFIRSMKVDFFKDRIFVITPRGDAKDLPAGSTPVDFAYQIHSDLGNTCTGAKVNGKFVPLNYELQSGDMVQIIGQKGKKPSEDWLKFVKTSMAREHIKAALKKKGALTRKAAEKTELKLVLQDRLGLLREIIDVITRSHVNIINVNTVHSADMRFPISRIEIATTQRPKIEKVMMKLQRIKGVKEISFQVL